MLSLLRSSPSLATAGVTVPRCFRCFSRSPAPYSDITKITISGKLFRAPELSTTSGGRQCVRYTVRSWKGKEKTNYFNFMCVTDNAKCIEFMTGLPRGYVLYVCLVALPTRPHTGDLPCGRVFSLPLPSGALGYY